MPLIPILICEIFDMWGIDFMGPFPSSFDKTTLIFYLQLIMFLRVKAKATRTNDVKTIVNFIKTHIFIKFVIPQAMISD